jgi:cell division protein FtsL
MTRVNFVLLLALVASSLWLVRSNYQARDLYFENERAGNEAKRLDAEFKRLDTERQAQARHGRVEAVARDKLGMRAATPAVTQYVSDSKAPGASAGSGVKP